MKGDPPAARIPGGAGGQELREVRASWPRLIVALGLLKILAGLVAGSILLFRLDAPFASRVPFLLGTTLAFTAGAFILLPSGRTNPAARYFGIVLLLGGTSYAGGDLLSWATSAIGFLGFLGALSHLQLSAFSPYFLWRFADVFPENTAVGRPARVVRGFARASLVLALVLFAANLLTVLEPLVPALGESGPLGWLRMRPVGTWYWPAVFVLTLSALAFLVWKARRASAPERLRSLAFAVAILVGTAPLLLVTIGHAVSQTVRDLFEHPTSAFWTLLIMDAAILTVPFTTGYAVLRHKVIDVRLILRKAIQYTLAKTVLISVTLLPIAALVVFLYRERDQTVAELLTGVGSASLAGLSVSAVVALRFRGTWLERLDRRFFREIYDLRRVLDEFAELSREAESSRDLAVAVARAVNNALHLDRIAVLFRNPLGGAYVTPNGVTTSLPVAALDDVPKAIGELLADSTEPLIYSPEASDRRLSSVSPTDLNWLSDSGYRLLVPLHTRGEDLAGALCLGEKLSDLPFSGQDRELLRAVAAKCSEALESRFLSSLAQGWRLEQSAAGGIDSHEMTLDAEDAQHIALECTSCGLVVLSQVPACTRCNGELRKLEIPRIVNGKFEIIERIGRGGMGVVYRALDLLLGRDVALKTLPRLSRKLSSRLRREARAIARVQHRHLATIYGAETWRRIPILVLEYLPGGTLMDRIARGALAPAEAAGVLAKIADALAAIHAAGLLHRDVKPSNVGFRENEPQLMDFGLAKLLFEHVPPVGGEAAPTTPAVGRWKSTTAATRGAAGTPLYMSPEALSGKPPDFDFDTWATCVTFFEALTGVHPFREEGEETTGKRIRQIRPRRLDELEGEYPEALQEFFDRAFSRRRQSRPRTAADLRDQLVRLQSELS